MTEPTAANEHEQHTTTIEITGNGQINAAFENTEGPEGAPTPQTPPPPPNHIQRPMTPPPQIPRPNTPPPQIPTTPQHETPHMNGDTPHMNGDTKANGVEVRTPGSEDTKEVNEAVNLELVNMQPYSNSIPIKKESTELDIGDPYDEYFVPVNQHKKYMRGEKLYVTQDKRRSLGGSKKKCCWGVLTVIVLGGIVAILIGVILSSQDNVPVEESRNFNGMKASIGGGIIPTPSPSSTPPPTRPTTDMSEIYLKNVLQGELTIDNLEFTPGLADKNSSEFRNLAASLEEELKSALFDHQTLHYGSADITVKVLEFRSGSVIVLYRVGWEFKDGIKNPPDPIDKDGLKTRLQEHLRSHDGFLYNYRLTLHNLKSERVTNICKIENGGCSQNCMFDSSSLEFTCKCEEPYVLSSDEKTCINPDKTETIPSSEEASLNTSEQKHGDEHKNGQGDGEEHDQKEEHGHLGEHEQGHHEDHEHLGEHEQGHHEEHEHLGEHEHGHHEEHEHLGEHEHGHHEEHEHLGEHEHGHHEEHEHAGDTESSSEFNKTTEHQSNENSETDVVEMPVVTEHLPDHDYHFETELKPEQENFGRKESSFETYVTPIPEHKHDITTGQTSQPSSEQNTQYMYENTYHQQMLESEYKKTPESVGAESMVEANDSTEAVSRNSSVFDVEKTTEPIPQMKSTDVTIDLDTSVPKFSPELPHSQSPMNFSEHSMESVHSTLLDHNEEMSVDTTPETTPLPPYNYDSKENAEPHHHFMQYTEVPVENTNPGDSSPTTAATSSERLAKYNQFPYGESEDTSYVLTTEKDIMPETTVMPKESEEGQNTVSELNIHQSSVNSHSSPQPPTMYTELHEEIPTGVVNSDNSEMKSSEFFANQKNENTMTTASFFNTDPKEDENSAEVGPATKNSMNVWETEEQPANVSSYGGYISSTNHVEEMTTMMPIIQGEGDSQNITVMIPKSMPISNASQIVEESSPESKTEFPSDEPTTQSSQNSNDMGSPQDELKTEGQTMPTERMNNTSFNSSEIEKDEPKPSSSPMDSMTIDFITMTTPSLLESATTMSDSTMPEPSPSPDMDPIFTNTNSNSSSKNLVNNESYREFNLETTEMPLITDTLITMNETESNNPPLAARSSGEHSNGAPMVKESKIPAIEESDSTVSTILVGGENMPAIALTPNPDLSGPYSVDSTIRPIPEEEDVEDTKPPNSFNSGGSPEGLQHWYDSKNALNSLDDDYNEEEKYASYKLVKGKPEHITKGYKSIKLEEKGRIPEDSDAVEQTHSHQIEQVPIYTSESSSTPNLLNTEKNESQTTMQPLEDHTPKIKEEEKLLIKEVYTEATGEPNNESERLVEQQSSSQDFNETRSEGFHEISINNRNKGISDDSVLKVMNSTSLQNITQTDMDDRNNYYAVRENVEVSEANPTTSEHLNPVGVSTLEESVPQTTMLYESESPSNNKTECDSEHFACHDGSKCLMKSQQCDGMQDCADGSDEEECEKLNCVLNFKCNNGMCLSKHLVCNGIQNCPDGSDEENCDTETKGEKEQPKSTESPVGKIETGSTDLIGQLPSSNTDIPAHSMEGTNSGTEANVVREEYSQADIGSNKTVISGTESPLSAMEPVMNEKEPDSRSMETIGGETATLGIPMETMMNSEVVGHTNSHLSSTEASMGKEAPMSPMESESGATELPQKLTDPKMKTNEHPASSIELNSSAGLNIELSELKTSKSPMENEKEKLISSSDSENSGTEQPAMSLESDMKSSQSPVTSKDPEMDSTDKPISSMESIVGGKEASFNLMESENQGREAPVNSMETNKRDNETPITPIPSGDDSGNMASTSIPVAREVSESYGEMASNNLTGITISSTTEPSKNIESSPAGPSMANTTATPSNNETVNQADGNQGISSSQITVSSTELPPTVMESSTSHSESSSKITESESLSTDNMSSSNETDTNSTELPSDIMEQIPIQTSLS